MAKPLTKEQTTACNECYTFFDYDKKDKIATSELKTMIRSLGQNPTEREIAEMIQQIDPTNSGDFSRAHFMKLMSDGWLKDFSTMEEELREAFQVFDKSGDGYVSITELRHALMKVGDSMADDELEEMMKMVDVDKDGRIGYEEFVKWFTSGRIPLA